MKSADAMRPPSSQRGYGSTWQKVRAEALRNAGIPEADWPIYDVDHVPRFNAFIEPDHRKYQLIPRRHGHHARKTIAETHRGVPAEWKRLQPRSGELLPICVMESGGGFTPKEGERCAARAPADVIREWADG